MGKDPEIPLCKVCSLRDVLCKAMDLWESHMATLRNSQCVCATQLGR